jgi:hypothetical protein
MLHVLGSLLTPSTLLILQLGIIFYKCSTVALISCGDGGMFLVSLPSRVSLERQLHIDQRRVPFGF